MMTFLNDDLFDDDDTFEDELIFRAIFFTKAKDVVLWVNHSDHLVIR